MRVITRGFVVVAGAALALAGAPPSARGDGAGGLAAAQKSGFSSWRDRTFSAAVDTHGAGEPIRTREIDVAERNDPDGGQRLVLEFTAPADVQGTIYLQQRPRSGEAQEWIWSPQSRKSRRLAPGTADESSSGAELSLRDLAVFVRVLSFGASDAEVTAAGEEVIDGRTYDVLAIAPRTDELPYTGYRLWVAREGGLPLRLEMTGSAGAPPKRVELRDFQTIDGHATPLTVEIVVPSTERRAIFRLRDVKYDRGLPESAFALSRLNRGR